ncbi:unnamed protein product [Urochloa humidicola]
MEAVFASGVAIGRFAMGSTEALGDPADAETFDVDPTDAPNPTENTRDASDSKAKGEASSVGKRKRGMSKEDTSSMAGLTKAVWGFAGAVKETIHSEGALGIIKPVIDCSNFTKPQLMFCLDHLMEHKKRSALGFVDMDNEQRDLWLTNHLIKHIMLD